MGDVVAFKNPAKRSASKPSVTKPNASIKPRSETSGIYAHNTETGWDIRDSLGFYSFGRRVIAEESDRKRANPIIMAFALKEGNRGSKPLPEIMLGYESDRGALQIYSYGYRDLETHERMKVLIPKIAEAVRKELERQVLE